MWGIILPLIAYFLLTDDKTGVTSKDESKIKDDIINKPKIDDIPNKPTKRGKKNAEYEKPVEASPDCNGGDGGSEPGATDQVNSGIKQSDNDVPAKTSNKRGNSRPDNSLGITPCAKED